MLVGTVGTLPILRSRAPRRAATQIALLVLTLGFGFSALLQVAQVQAQTKASEPAAYRALIDEALREYEAKHFAEARSLFLKASAVLPSARALRGVGMAEFELRNYADSATSLDQALASDVKPLEGELRAETERLLNRARSFIARLVVGLQPAEASVFVDGMLVALGPQGDLILEVGDHTLEFRAEGYVPQVQRLKVKGGELDQLRVSLLPAVRTEPAPAVNLTLPAQRPNGQDDTRRPLYKNPWLWTGVGIVVAGAAAGIAIALTGSEGGSMSATSSMPAAIVRGP